MVEMRERFEKLTEIRDSLSEHIVFIGNTYTTPSPDFYDLVNWLNGAWYAFQEQHMTQNAIQKKQSMHAHGILLVDTFTMCLGFHAVILLHLLILPVLLRLLLLPNWLLLQRQPGV